MLYRKILKPLFFLFDAESVHEFVMRCARIALGYAPTRNLLRISYVSRASDQVPVQTAGLTFQNPIGLAAGFDKNGWIAPHLDTLGFGFAEIGTVTPKAQAGNDRPRLFRIPEETAILNRMGFNNDGMDVIAERLHSRKTAFPIGVNIGKNKVTPNENAIDDYELVFKRFAGLATYFTVNISSPNTPGLRDLQSVEFLDALARKVRDLRLAEPVLVKLAPEIPFDLLKETARYCGAGKPFAGVILTNTIGTERGGISGMPLKKASVSLLKQARSVLPTDATVISVGGIFTADDVMERLQLGANAVQLYTSLIYEGPGLVGRILKELKRREARGVGLQSLKSKAVH